MGQQTKRQSAWRGSVSSSALLASLGVIGFSASSSESWAACTGGPINFVCSGAETTPQTVSATGAAVSTNSGFSVNVVSSNALTIEGIGPISYIDTNASPLTVTGAAGTGLTVRSLGDDGPTPGSITIQTNGAITGVDNGIYALNFGGGATNVTASGTVISTAGMGIAAYAGSVSGTGVSVDAASVTGATYGIFVENPGGGITSVKASGLVTGTSDTGIYAYASGPTGTGLSVEAASATGAHTGIYAQNDGGGLTSITASGTVTGTNSYGIYALSSSAGTGLSIDVAAVTSNHFGIFAQNDGGGTTSVKATGTVTGTSNSGIFAYASNPAGTGLSVEAAAVTGGAYGIYAENSGGGTTSVKATGLITGTSGPGIYARALNTAGIGLNVEAAAVTGTLNGIDAQNNGGGLTSVNATGTVTGTSGSGISAVASSSTGTGLSVEAAAVSGSNYGIFARNNGGGTTSVKASGTVTGANNNGIYAYASNSTGTGLSVEAATVGGLNGIYAQNFGGGLTSVKATGTVTGTNNNGIYATANNATGTGLSIDAAAVTGLTYGIYTVNQGRGLTSIKASGMVTGTNDTGIYAFANNTAGTGLSVEAAAVSGRSFGILVQNEGGGTTSVKATGTVSSNNYDGINVAANNSTGTGLSVEAAAVSGGTNGITALNNGGGITRITASGLVTGNRYGIVAANNQLSFLSNGNLNSIAGQTANPATDVIVQASGGVTGGLTGVLAFNSGTGQLQVDARGGAVSGGTRDGIVALNSNATNTPSNLSVTSDAVSGGRNGIVALNAGIGSNTVTADGAVNGGASGYGIAAVNGTFDVYAAVNSGSVATTGDAGTGLTVTANSTVSGGTDGIFAYNRGSGLTKVTATGTVTGASGTGIFAYASNSAGTGLSVEAASITGFVGINAQNHGGGATNVKASGAVTGTDGIGIFAYAANATGTGLSVEATSVTGTNYGIKAQNDGGGTTSVKATGAVFDNTNSAGIFVYAANTGGTGLSIDVATVGGRTNGIDAQNDGGGLTSIKASGTVTSTTGYGIAALANNATGSGLTVEAATVTANNVGISALNNGGGLTSVKASGMVTGTNSVGILVIAGSAGAGLNVEATDVTGRNFGINARNNGGGLTSVKASGMITGTNGTGLYASASNPGAGLSVEAASVSGYSTGIYALNNGGGLTSVKATGTVTSTVDDGINASAGILGSGFSVDVATVTGGKIGINALNVGGGTTSVKASGPVIGSTDTGVYVYAGSAGSGLSVDVGAVTGNNSGINAENRGGGLTSVKATGTVSGAIAHGIFAYAGSAGTGLSVETAAVSGASRGIYTNNQGAGVTQITAGGMVSGSVAAIDAISVGTPIIIDVTSAGGLRNASGAMTALAVRTAGGAATLTNAGVITGIVRFGAAGNIFNNSGIWNTAGGTNTFGGASDVMTNLAGGTFNAAGVGAVATTTLDALGNFVNQGRVTLVNGMTGDILKINGNARFDSGSVYALDIDGAGNSDRILVSGSAQLGGTLALNAPLGTQVAVGTRYTVLTATGGVSGKWNSIQGTAFLTLAPGGALSDTYDANNSFLEATQMILVQPRPFVAAALTPNQIGTALGLDSIPKSGALFSAVGLLPNDVAARNAFDQLSGEAHASARTALVDGSQFVRSGMLDRLLGASNAPGAAPVPVMSYAPGGPIRLPGTPVEQFSIWGQAYGAWGRWNGNGNAATLNRSFGGLSLGLDTPLLGTSTFPLRVGVMAGYGNTGFSVGQRGSSGTSDNYHLGAYASAEIGGFGLRAGLAHTWHDIRTTRIVNFPGFNDMLRANYNGRTTQVFGDLGYKMQLKMGFGTLAIEPFANLAYVNLRTAAFREVGGPAALAAASATSHQTFTTLGARGATTFDLGGLTATARGTLGWRHAFGAVIPGSAFAFAGGAPFSIAGIAVARNAAVVEAGLDIAIAPGATLGIAYNGQLARSAQDHAIKGNLAVRF